MDKHVKFAGTAKAFHIPRCEFTVNRSSTQFPAVTIDGYLQLKASSLLNGKGILGSLTQNYHDFRVDLEEPDW